MVERYAPRAYIYAFWVGVCELVVGLISFGVVSAVEGVDSRTLLGGMLTGAISAAGFLLILFALKLGQVSRIVPVWYLYPLMVAPMAAVFLDERLSALAVGAILLAVAGSALVSWQGGTGSRIFGNPASLLLALCAGALMAISIILSKYFLESGPFWQVHSAFRIGFALALLWVILLPGMRREAAGMVRHGRFMGFLVLAEAIVTASVIVRFAAINLGQVSLVAAISTLQPTLVFLYSIGLATLSPPNFSAWITRRTLRPQFAGIAAITAGVVIITLL